MKKIWLKRVAIVGICSGAGFLGFGLVAYAAEYHEKLSTVVTPIVSEAPQFKSLETLHQEALGNPSEENVQAYLKASKEGIEREKKLESMKEVVLSKNPSLKTFYEHHELELSLENARKRFVEAQYQSAFQDSLSCQKPNQEPLSK